MQNAQSSGLSEHAIADTVAEYTEETVDRLFNLLIDVIRVRQAEIEPVIRNESTVPINKPDLLMRSLQAQGIWFQLLNIAEENAGMRRRRMIETESGPHQLRGTFARVLNDASETAIPAEHIQSLFEQARIRPVITAHPTEAKRVTVLEIHRRIYLLLMQIESTRWTPREREALINDLRNEIDLLWLTGELRLEKPSVDQEVSWGLHFFKESLFDRLPELHEKMELALKHYYPDHDFKMPPFFQFGSWIGGDRDGNPFVTNEVTRKTLFRYRLASLYRYRQRLESVCRSLSITESALNISQTFLNRLNTMLKSVDSSGDIAKRNPGEVYRQYSVSMLKKLNETVRAAELNATPSSETTAYRTADRFIDDLSFMEQTMVESQCESLAAQLVTPLRREVETFRFRTLNLDIRQNSTVTTETLAAIWSKFNQQDASKCPQKDSSEWKQWILSELGRPLDSAVCFDDLSEQAQSTIETMRLIGETQIHMDSKAFGCYILSMTQSAADILGVYVLAKLAGLFSDFNGNESCAILVVPLFETIDDLQAAPDIMRELFSVPIVGDTIKRHGGTQEIMIGYSDSNKDGGYLSSNWELSVAQSSLTQAGHECGFPISFFHGRGGSVSRGGAPTGRAIAAQPPGSVHGQMRVTEQGEVVSLKFANQGTALYHMELLAASVLEHTLKSEQEQALQPNSEFDDAMESLSNISYAAYRRLAEQPGLVMYYGAASPVEELALLNIGSRPARRFGAKSLADLRAIPWVFAWTQNRHLVPSWYGLGSALEEFTEKSGGGSGTELLERMFQESRLFRLVLDEAEKTLSQVDLSIAKEYADLVPDSTIRDQIFGMIEKEYHRTVTQVLKVSDSNLLAERFPRFRRDLARRLPTINQIGREQVRLIKAFRELDKDDNARQKQLIPLLLSINCIAAGLGWTG